MVLQDIWGRVVGNVLLSISPSNIMLVVLKPERFHHDCQAGLTALSINGLNHASWDLEIGDDLTPVSSTTPNMI